MKRSEIKPIMRSAHEFIHRCAFYLPRFSGYAATLQAVAGPEN
jgi:hypothetical protein